MVSTDLASGITQDYLTYPFHNPDAAFTGPFKYQTQDDNVVTESGNESTDCETLAQPDLSLDSSDCSNESSSRLSIDSSLSGLSTSNDSTPSSVRINQHHNAAFAKLRTALPVPGSIAQDLPEEWKTIQPPSLSNGDWRTFGPTEAVLATMPVNQGSTYTDTKKLKKELDKHSSTVWKGTIWLTGVSACFSPLVR
jgi:hypothetical protein